MTERRHETSSFKKRLVSSARLGKQRIKQFLAIPALYRQVRAFKDCKRSRLGLAADLLTLFFSYRTFPNNYVLCRLWEVDRGEWKYYYGSNYLPHQFVRLTKTAQPLAYRVIFNDKYLCVLLCKALGIRVPLTHGVLDPSRDYRAQIREWLDASPGQKLIIKPLFGEMGRDIVLAERAGNEIIIKSGQAQVPLEEFALHERSIVQEFLTEDPRMGAFSPSSVNTVRVVTMLTPQGEAIIVNASFRSGVGDAFVDNWSAGGVSVGIDCHRGTLKKYAYDKRSNRYSKHPTSGIVFENRPVPEWDRICDAAAAVQRAFSFYRLLGLDIALDQFGDPVLIEANGAPDLAGLEQKAGPLLKNEAALKAFGEYDLLVNKHQRKLYENLVKQSS